MTGFTMRAPKSLSAARDALTAIGAVGRWTRLILPAKVRVALSLSEKAIVLLRDDLKRSNARLDDIYARENPCPPSRKVSEDTNA